jgi:hypothetical protein
MAAISFQPYASLQNQSMVLVGEPMEVTLINFELNTFVKLELVSAKTGEVLCNTSDVKFESVVIPTSKVHLVPFTFLQTTYVMAQDDGIYIRASYDNAMITSSLSFHVVFNVSVCKGSVRVDTTEDVNDVEVLFNLLQAYSRLTDIQREEIHRLRVGVLEEMACPESPMFRGL